MKNMEDYKRELMDQPSPYLRDKLIAEADEAGFTAWELAELAGVCREVWA